MKIYKMQNCPHCEKVQWDLVEKFGIEIVDIHSPEYDGFVPDQVPVFQTQGLTLMGPFQINGLLNVINNAKTKE